MSDGTDPDDDDAEDKRIYSDCIGDDYLKAGVERDVEEERCAYCKKRGKTTSIGELADDIGGAFKLHYYRTPTEPSNFEYTMSKETDYQWERTGEQTGYAIAGIAGLEEDAAEDVRQVLEDRNGDFDGLAAGEEGGFDEESHYEAGDADITEIHHEWLRFQKSLRIETRLFNASAQAVLESVPLNWSAHIPISGCLHHTVCRAISCCQIRR